MKIALVDDQQECADVLNEYILRYAKENDMPVSVSEYRSGMEFLCGEGNFDVIFMDVKMPHFNGLETAKELRKNSSSACIVFVTNYAQYAIKGYEVQAFDYMLKPVLYGNFCICMEKLIRQIDSQKNDQVCIDCEDGYICLSSSEIYYVESNLHHVIYHTQKGIYRKRGKLAAIEEELKKFAFVRASASYLVNLRYVEQVKDCEAIVAGETLALSRSRKNDFMAELTTKIDSREKDKL